MGYYSNFNYYIESARVNNEKIREMEEFFSNEENNDIYGFFNVEIDVDDIDAEVPEIEDINVEDNYAKFYDDRLFAEKLSTALVDGFVELYFVGEDGDHWGYRVMPNRVYTMSVQWIVDDPDYPID